jgi:UDP-N-acetylglucosamine:LPS N-acetylglucosamine transferase
VKVLFVTYGGGHVEMVLPVMQALRAAVPGVRIQLLALTTAAGPARRAGEQPLGFRDFFPEEDAARVIGYGERLLGDQQHPDVERSESLAYLGANFAEWVDELGESRAWERWRQVGRQGFLPVRFFDSVLRQLAPDVVVATNSPRSEQAALQAARALGIPTLSMVDLFALPGDPYRDRAVHADRITVLAEATRGNLVQAGVEPARVVVTGNPAFDALAGAPAAGQGRALRQALGWGDAPVVLWAGHLEPVDADPRWVGTALGDAVVHRLLQWLPTRDARLAIRYHPNEWHRFTQPALDPQVHWSRPDQEPLLPVLAAADIVIVQATTVGAQAFAAGKQVVSLPFSPIVQRTGMDFAALGMATPAASPDDVPAVLDALLASCAAPSRERAAGGAAERVAREIVALARGGTA